jgi:hypothetical protein
MLLIRKTLFLTGIFLCVLLPVTYGNKTFNLNFNNSSEVAGTVAFECAGGPHGSWTNGPTTVEPGTSFIGSVDLPTNYRYNACIVTLKIADDLTLVGATDIPTEWLLSVSETFDAKVNIMPGIDKHIVSITLKKTDAGVETKISSISQINSAD